MAARSVWTGSLSFGLVNVPIKLTTAVTERTVRFNQINAKTGNKIKQKRVDSITGDEVDFTDIVKGYELAPDRIVVIDPAELEAVAPKQTNTVEIEEFVPASVLDTMAFSSSYYIGPEKGGAKPYRMLVQAMTDSGTVAIGRIIMRSKEKMVAVRVKDGVLVCSTLVFADEINPADRQIDMETLESAPEPSEREVSMATMLISSMTNEDFDYSAYRDSFRDKVLTMIEAKASGEEYTPEAVAETVDAPDLMAALEASLAATSSAPVTKKKPAAKRKTPAKAAA